MDAPSLKKIEQKFLLYISQNKLISKADKILVAFSGGADSTFVLYLLKKYERKFNAEIFAMHVNHGLRGSESERDEKHCENVAKELNIPFYSARINVKSFARKNKFSLEEAARILRYAELEKAAEQISANKIATAHNLNDNTETVLLNIFKGKGTQAAAGIPAKRGKIIRPALSISRDEILFWLKNNSVSFVVDSTNNENDFLRNKIRNRIIPLIKSEINESLDNSVSQFSQILLLQNEFVSGYVKFRSASLFKFSEDVPLFEINQLKDFELNILGELLKFALLENFNYKISFTDVEKIRSLITNQKGKSEELQNGYFALREKNEIVFMRKNKATANFLKSIKVNETVEFNGNLISIKETEEEQKKGNCEIISADGLSDKFILRNWKSGDKFIPLGMTKHKKISDFLTDIKIPSIERKNILVLENNSEIIWVVGLRISEKVKITNETKKRLELCVNTTNQILHK